MKTLKTQVPIDVKQQFVKRAKRKKLSESELLRLIVVTELAEIGSSESEEYDNEDESDVKTSRVNVRLPIPMQLEIDRRRASAGGMARSTWIRSLVQSNLLNIPIMTDGEVIALAESNRQLAAIGRNLNQIARALNLAYHETGRIKLEQIESVIETIDGHRQHVAALISAAEGRWSIVE